MDMIRLDLTKKWKGKTVKYTSGDEGDSIQNPLWGGTHGEIKGKVTNIDRTEDTDYPICVDWENKESNQYTEDDLEIITK
jgi:hypothetical protein